MKSTNAPNPQFVRRIAVDDRERRSGVPAALANHPNLEVTIRRLKLGDYFIDKREQPDWSEDEDWRQVFELD